MVAPEGEDGEGDRGGDEVLEHPPPPQPAVLALPEWLQKALRKGVLACRKAATAPWSTQVLNEGCGPHQPIFFDL